MVICTGIDRNIFIFAKYINTLNIYQEERESPENERRIFYFTVSVLVVNDVGIEVCTHNQ